jgi:hypothetical protein
LGNSIIKRRDIMPKYIIEQDNQVTETWFYAVEAESLDDAIEQTTGMKPHAIKSYPSEEATYDDSHEATDEEWNSLSPNAGREFRRDSK